MATPPLSDEILRRAVNAKKQHDGNVTAAAMALGLSRTTLQSQLYSADLRGILPDETLVKPRARVPAGRQAAKQETGKPLRVLVWGCAHDTPSFPDKSRFRHAGLLASDLRPDYIVDVGDALDLDSLSMHAAPGSKDDRAKPAFLAEIHSLEDAYGEFDSAAPNDIPRYHLDGNHEYRADRFEKNNPTSEGVYTIPLRQVFERYQFTTKGFREWLFLADVGFTHVPINMAGKEYGGKTVENLVMNDATFSMVYSHTHRHHFARRPKIGNGNAIQSYNTGSMMPWGYIKEYAAQSTTGWTYGISELTVRDGQIESARYWSVRELAERYG